MRADDILKNLADGEQEDGSRKVDHWLLLAEDSEDKNGLQYDKNEEEQQWRKLIENIEADVSVVAGPARIEMSGPGVTSIERNVSSANGEGERGNEDEPDGLCSAIINELITDHGIQHQYPSRSNNGGDMYPGERLQRISSCMTTQELIYSQFEPSRSEETLPE